ncbi:hypothetical protein ABPG72_016814 [Tetrahymena utriculariae]
MKKQNFQILLFVMKKNYQFKRNFNKVNLIISQQSNHSFSMKLNNSIYLIMQNNILIKVNMNQVKILIFFEFTYQAISFNNLPIQNKNNGQNTLILIVHLSINKQVSFCNHQNEYYAYKKIFTNSQKNTIYNKM